MNKQKRSPAKSRPTADKWVEAKRLCLDEGPKQNAWDTEVCRR